jgi:transcriptional regulator with XRE-family HTH domain
MQAQKEERLPPCSPLPLDMGAEKAAESEFNRAICARITALRVARGWSQAQVANVLDLKATSYPKYENRNPPSYQLLARIALLYNVTLDHLITGSESPFGEPRSNASSKRRAG